MPVRARRVFSFRCRTWTCVVLVLPAAMAGCRGQPNPPKSPSSTEGVPLHRGPLTDYVPAAGLRWMVAGSPRVFADNPQFLAAFQHLVPEERLAAFASGSGVELRTLPEGCIAGFDYGTLYLARVGVGTHRVQEQFETRLVSEPIKRSPQPGVWRTTGLIANTPESLLTVDGDFSAVALRDPLLIRIVEGFALGRFKKSSPALHGAALSTLPSELQTAPLRFYAPGPFSEALAKGVQGLLARAFAVGAAASLNQEGQLKVRVVVTGAFGPDLDESRARLMRTWDAILTSAVGHVLGLEQTVVPGTFDLHVRDDQAVLDFALNSELLMRGISAAVQDDVKSILEL
jgi:hypothetical protein